MRTLALVVLAALAPGAAVAQEPARAVIERAITAHGGHEKLSRARADRARLQGSLYIGLSRVAFTNDVTVQLPRLYRSVVQMQEGNRTRTVVHCLENDQPTISLDGQPQAVSASHATQLRQTLELESALRLVPLLSDSRYTLQHLGDFKLEGRVVVGIRVAGRGQRDLKLYFDRQTALLVKTEHLLDGPGGQDVTQEAYYRDYREVGGWKRPGRVAAYRDGKKVMEAELIDAQPLP